MTIMPADSPRETLDALLGVDVGALDDEKALKVVGHIIDFSDDLRDAAALDRAFEMLEEARVRSLTPRLRTLLHYFEGNAWSARTHQRSNAGGAWAWEAEDLAGKILAYRRAVLSDGFESLPLYQRCQILTNLGNAMSNVGRFVEAIDYWDRVVALKEDFGMALAGKGDMLIWYLYSLYDEGHQAVFAHVAHELLRRALALPLEGDTAARLHPKLDYLRNRAPEGFFDTPLALDNFDLGETAQEQEYRSWCLERRLFVNPMNDALPEAIAAADSLNLPRISGSVDEMGTGRAWMGLYNVLKQEFIGARTLLWEGLTATEPHFADEEVNLMDTLDDSRFGLAREKTKFALRSAYSILDRVGFLVNSYFRLGIAHHRVQFRTLWYLNGQKNQGLRSEFVDRENWPLRGLFWLSKDLDGSEQGIQECLEPDAQALQDLRNHLEHKYAKVIDDEAFDQLPIAPDELCLRITTSDLNAKALRTVRLARAALVYVSLTIHAEERRKSPGEGQALSIETPRIRGAR